jgi:hypothetical protein
MNAVCETEMLIKLITVGISADAFAVRLGSRIERGLMESEPVIDGLCEFEHLDSLVFRRMHGNSG